MEEYGSSPAVHKSSSGINEGDIAAEQIKEPPSDEQTKSTKSSTDDDSDFKKEIEESNAGEEGKESLSLSDTKKPAPINDKDDSSKESAQTDPVADNDSVEEKETIETSATVEIETNSEEPNVDKDAETECKEPEKPSPKNDASALDSAESSTAARSETNTEESTAMASPPEAETDDLEQLILEKKYGERSAARATSLVAGVRDGEDRALLKEYGATTNESETESSMTHTAPGSTSTSNPTSSVQMRPGAFPIYDPGSESSTHQAIVDGNASAHNTSVDNWTNDEAPNIDTAPLATVVLARRSTSIQESHHDDPEAGQRFLEAVCVEDQNIVEAKIVAVDDMEDSRDRPSLLKRYGIAAVVLLITIVILIVVVSTRQEKPTNPEKDPTTGKLVEKPEFSYDYERAKKVLRIVAPLSGEKAFDPFLRESSLAHEKALGLLANDYFLSYDDPSIEWKVRQRYVLTLLYTSTAGWKWHENYFFLSEFDECNWSFTSLAGADDQDPFSDKNMFTAHGVLCNANGLVDRIKLRWNNLVGTLPHELSEFASSLTELNFDGGSLSGQIPQSFEKLTKLEKLSLQDNCFTGTIPDFTKLSNLHTILLGNNDGLSGSLNEYCVGTERVSHIRNLYADCGNAIECDCCGCCDPNSFECCSEERGCFISANMNNVPEDTHIMAFNKICLSDQSKQWIMQECPCYIFHPPEYTKKECTTDCDAEGAIASSNFLQSNKYDPDKEQFDNKP